MCAGRQTPDEQNRSPAVVTLLEACLFLMGNPDVAVALLRISGKPVECANENYRYSQRKGRYGKDHHVS